MLAPLSKSLRIVGPGALALMLMATPAFAAQGTPSALGNHDLGAFIREGSCGQPSKVIEDIGDLSRDRDVWSVIGQDEQEPGVVYGEDEGIDQSIDALLSGGYVVTIHSRDDSNAGIIACGVIEGAIDSDGTLMVDLKEVNNSGVIGRVHFGPSHDDDDEETEVTTAVWAGTNATPAATPVG